MRSSKIVRLAGSACLILGLCIGVIVASAQDTTPEATPDATQEMMMSQMMAMQGACPQDAAATMLANMNVGATPMVSSTEASGVSTPEATTATGTEEVTGVKCLFGQFSGAAEVPGPGASGAAGFVFVSVDPSSGNICYEEAVTGITLPASATHIHVNAAGQSGSVVVPFPVAPDSSGMASGCTNAKVAGLAQAIVSNPAGYYVNVHTSDFPNGAARAQLSAWDSSMMSSMMTATPMMSSTESAGTSSGMVTPAATSGS